MTEARVSPAGAPEVVEGSPAWRDRQRRRFEEAVLPLYLETDRTTGEIDVSSERDGTWQYWDTDGTPLTSEDFARSLDEAEEELRLKGPVPPAEVARVIAALEAELRDMETE